MKGVCREENKEKGMIRTEKREKDRGRMRKEKERKEKERKEQVRKINPIRCFAFSSEFSMGKRVVEKIPNQHFCYH